MNRRKTRYKATDARRYTSRMVAGFRGMIESGMSQQAAAKASGIPEGSAWYLARRARG